MSEIYFFRHGQASFGAENYDQLSPTGIRQACITAEFLTEHGISFDAVYSGQMERQKQTAKPLCDFYKNAGLQGCKQDCNPYILSNFDEYNSLPLFTARVHLDEQAGIEKINIRELRKNRKAFQHYFSETINRWVSKAFDHEAGVESWENFCERVRTGIKQIIEQHGQGRRIAVFTSGGPISVVVKTALGLSDKKTIELNWQIMNASITCIKYNKNGISLWFFNTITQLLIQKDASLLTYR